MIVHAAAGGAEATGRASSRTPRSGFLLSMMVILAVPVLIIAGVLAGVPPWVVFAAMLVGPSVVVLLWWTLRFVPVWFTAASRGVETSPGEIIRLRRRGAEPMRLVRTAISLREAGIRVTLPELASFDAASGSVASLGSLLPQLERRRIGWEMQELTHLARAGFDVPRALASVIEADDTGRRLTLASACEIQMDDGAPQWGA